MNSTNLRRFTPNGDDPQPKVRKDPVLLAEKQLAEEELEDASIGPAPKRSKIEEKENVSCVGESQASPRELVFYPVSSTWMRGKSQKLSLNCVSIRRKVKPQIRRTTDPPPKTTTKIIGDGNCLFRTLSHVLTNSEDSYKDLRKLICDRIISNGQRYLGSQSANDYIKSSQMDRDRVWGTDVELQAASDLLETRIYCFGPQLGGNAWVEFNPETCSSEEGIFIINLESHFEPIYKW